MSEKLLKIENMSEEQRENLIAQFVAKQDLEKAADKDMKKIVKICSSFNWKWSIEESPVDRNKPEGDQKVRLCIKNHNVHGSMKGIVLNRTMCELFAGERSFTGAFPLTKGTDFMKEVQAQLNSEAGEKITR
jgi:hypothetical protein